MLKFDMPADRTTAYIKPIPISSPKMKMSGAQNILSKLHFQRELDLIFLKFFRQLFPDLAKRCEPNCAYAGNALLR